VGHSKMCALTLQSPEATSNNMKLVHWPLMDGLLDFVQRGGELVHWPLMGGLLHLVQRGGDWAGP